MKKIAISFDLDNTVFDVSELYLEAWRVTGHKAPTKTKGYPTRWDFMNDPAFPKSVCDYLLKSFYDGKLLTYTCSTFVADKLNDLLQSSLYDVYFITDRDEKLDSYGQLRKNKIKASPKQVIISHQKDKTLKEMGIQIHCDDNPWVLEKLVPQFQGVLPVLMSNQKTLYNHYMRDKTLVFGKQKVKVPTFNDLAEALQNLETILSTFDQCLDFNKKKKKS